MISENSLWSLKIKLLKAAEDTFTPISLCNQIFKYRGCLATYKVYRVNFCYCIISVLCSASWVLIIGIWLVIVKLWINAII